MATGLTSADNAPSGVSAADGLALLKIGRKVLHHVNTYEMPGPSPDEREKGVCACVPSTRARAHKRTSALQTRARAHTHAPNTRARAHTHARTARMRTRTRTHTHTRTLTLTLTLTLTRTRTHSMLSPATRESPQSRWKTYPIIWSKIFLRNGMLARAFRARQHRPLVRRIPATRDRRTVSKQLGIDPESATCKRRSVRIGGINSSGKHEFTSTDINLPMFLRACDRFGLQT